MIAIDTNVLVYAHRRESVFHESASSTVRELAEGRNAWAIPWPCVYEFFSVVTNPRIWKGSESSQTLAWQQLMAWKDSPSSQLLAEPVGFENVLKRFVCRPRVRGGVVHDARIAALCVAHGVDSLLTCDRDFSLFPELKTVSLAAIS